MADRPYVLLSCSMSIDGYLGGPTEDRLMLSNAADLDRVDAVRAGWDAILVGANTVRRDNPRLSVRSRSGGPVASCSGEPASPIKVTVTGGGELDPGRTSSARVGRPSWSTAPRRRLPIPGAGWMAWRRWSTPGIRSISPAVLSDLTGRGVRRLMVEGGGRTHTQFLAGELADELQLVVAPLLVGDPRAPRFVPDGDFPWPADRRARLAEVRQIGDVVLLRYALSEIGSPSPTGVTES